MAPVTEITFYACLSVAGHLWIKPPPVYSALAFLFLINIKAWPLSYTVSVILPKFQYPQLTEPRQGSPASGSRSDLCPSCSRYAAASRKVNRGAVLRAKPTFMGLPARMRYKHA